MRRFVCAAIAVAVAGMLAAPIAQAGGEKEARARDAAWARKLPAPVVQTMRDRFPGALIHSAGRERETDVLYYEVNLRRGEDRFEVEVAPDGSVGEIEGRVKFENLPEPHQDRIRAAVGAAKIKRVEKHVRIGQGKEGSFVPLEKPVGFYEVKCLSNGNAHEKKVAIDPADVWLLRKLEPEEDDADEEDDD